MIAEGMPAPDFTLQDQFGRKVSLADFRDRQHVLLLFYPLDWTPT
jgi:peroxiredoxin